MIDLTLDHVVIAVRDVDEATDDYTALLGREPSWRGEHPQYGTRNTLFRIDNTYVELLGLNMTQRKRRDPRWGGELARFLERGEGLYALALGTSEVDATARLLRERGMQVDDPRDGHGLDRISGARRDWRNAQVPLKASNGARIFIIEHRSPPEALPPAAPVAPVGIVRRMDHAVVLSPDMEASRRLWGDTLGARLALDRTFPERNTRILFFRLADITIEISGGAEQTAEGINKPDRLWGLAWGVDNLDATIVRLRAAGIDVSEARRGIKPGTLVSTAKGKHAHGVPTLLIEHLPESFRPESREPHGMAYDNAPDRRAFRVLGLDHVALAVEDADAAAVTWRSTLGLETSELLEPPDTHLKLAKVPAGNGLVVLAQAKSPEHRIGQWIAQRGPGMYAIAIDVDNIDAAVADLRAKGVFVSDPEFGVWPGTRVARINAAAANGVSIQLVQHMPEVL